MKQFGNVRGCSLVVCCLLLLSSWAIAGDLVVKFEVRNRATGEVEEVSGQVGEMMPLSGKAKLSFLSYKEDYNGYGPAAIVRIEQDGAEQGSPILVLSRHPQFDEKRGGQYIVSVAENSVVKFEVRNRATGEVEVVSGKVGEVLSLSGEAKLSFLSYKDDFNGYGPAAFVRIQHVGAEEGSPVLLLFRHPQFDEKRGGQYVVSMRVGQ